MVLERRRDGNIEVLTLNRPEARNALSPELIGALSEAFEAIAHDDGVRAVVLAGAGDRAFCAGMDLKSFAARSATGEQPPVVGGSFKDFLEGQYPKPIIGAANATAVAGGFELLLACDVIVASSHAKFGIPEVKRGLFAAGGGTLLPARLPLAIALELGLTGDLIDAQRALKLGLINRVVPPGDVESTALDLAGQISANGPLAVVVTKKLMRLTHDRGVAASREAQQAEHALVFDSSDAQEGALAFAERREPRWKGR